MSAAPEAVSYTHLDVYKRQGESPYIPQTYRSTGCRQYKSNLPGKCTSLMFVFLHNSSFPITYFFHVLSLCLLNFRPYDDTMLLYLRQIIYQKKMQSLYFLLCIPFLLILHYLIFFNSYSLVPSPTFSA